MIGFESLQDDGFKIVRGALNKECCLALDKFFTSLPLEATPKLGIEFAKNCISRSPRNLVIKSVLSYLNMSCNKVLYDEFVQTSNSHLGSFPWHQDIVYFPKAELSIFVALSSLKGNQSGLDVVPGSQIGGPLPHIETGAGLALVSPSSSTSISLDRGDIVLVHPCLIHSMRGNLSSHRSKIFSIVAGAETNESEAKDHE